MRRDLRLLVWLTQLGFSIAFPLAGFILLSLWLKSRYDLGVWVIVAGVVFGIAGAVDGLRTSLKAMERMSPSEKKKEADVVFNDHE